MFTGIIEETGILKRKSPSSQALTLTIEASVTAEDTKIGDSLAVDGVCLTVVELGPGFLTMQAVTETVEHSTIPGWNPGRTLNLERAMSAGGRFGGHIVQGHVDGIGVIKAIEHRQSEIRLTVSAGRDIMSYVVHKGSVTIDGISLTVASTENDSFSVAIIPHTWKNTNLCGKNIGSRVNLETDILARYVEKFLAHRESGPELNEDFLRKAGF